MASQVCGGDASPAAFRIPFECISRADRLNPEMLDPPAELGCFRIWIGSESGSQRILDSMDRGVKIEQVQQAVAMSRERGIQSGMFLLVVRSSLDRIRDRGKICWGLEDASRLLLMVDPRYLIQGFLSLQATPKHQEHLL